MTADHGNIEVLHTPEGKPHVSHTTNLVACIALGEGTEQLKAHGKLCEGIDKGYDFIVTNFANGDVIGHTSSDSAKPRMGT